MRRPVGVGTSPIADLVVVCDDGSVFTALWPSGETAMRWVQNPPIPGTLAGSKFDAPRNGPIPSLEELRREGEILP